MPLPRLALLTTLILSVLTGCAHRGSPHHRKGITPHADALAHDLDTTRNLIAKSLNWRQRSSAHIAALDLSRHSRALTSAELTRTYAGAVDYIWLRRRWQAMIDIQGEEAWDQPATILANDPLARLQVKLVLAAALTQYDDYVLGVAPYFGQPQLRRLLKNDHPAINGELDATTRHFVNPVLRQRLAQSIVWHRRNPTSPQELSADEAFLDQVITQSPAYRYFTRDILSRTTDETVFNTHAAITYIFDHIRTFGEFTTHHISKGIGNTLGLIATRRGYLETLSTADQATLATRLQPLDILLEKTPFRLTDGSIPGHYGHVAIWVGDETQLRALDLWEHPLVRPHHEKIRSGARIIEALRPGVEINTLAHFLNIDDLLVLRQPALSLETQCTSLLLAFAQIGKDYDFNFDVESDEKIVCSELAYVTFPDLEWPSSMTLGRYSITPDQVASLALDHGPFRPIVLYHDGVEITQPIPEVLRALLSENYSALRTLCPDFKGRSATQ